MSTDDALYESDGPIATLTFNRPDARNAMTWDMIGAGLAGVYLFLYITLRQQDYALLMFCQECM